VTEGAFVGRGEATLLATIEQLRSDLCNFTQSGSDLVAPEAGRQMGRLTTRRIRKSGIAAGRRSLYPKPADISSRHGGRPGTGAVSLRAEFPIPNSSCLPGMFVRVRFPEALAENVIRVPQRAVQGGPQGQFVTCRRGKQSNAGAR